MKKIILSAIAIFTIGMVNAQELRFGAKAGANLSTLTGDAVGEEISGKVGFHAGGLIEIKFTDKLSLQPEVLYSLQGAKIEDRDDFGGGEYDLDEYKLHLSYINVPVMLKFYPAKGFFIEAGPQIGFLVGAKAKSEFTQVRNTGDGTTTTTTSTDNDVKDLYKSVDFGFNVGLGYDFTDNIYINARYNFGLANVRNVPDVFGIDFGFAELDQKNGVGSLSVGFKF